MKSIFRIYAKTSKGNDIHLLNQLKSMNLNPKYDQHLNSFYFNSTFTNLFQLSFKCMTIQQMYVQIGQKFRLIDQDQIKTELQKLPFKNFIPIQRGLVQNTTLKILIRQSAHTVSDNVLTNLITTNFQRQITKKQYYKFILQSNQQKNISSNGEDIKSLTFKTQRKNHESFFQIKDIVEKKWFEQDQTLSEIHQNKMILLQKELKQLNQMQQKLPNNSFLPNKAQSQQNKSITQAQFENTQIRTQNAVKIQNIKNQLKSIKEFDHQTYLSEMLSYHPHLIFYIRKNKGRFLLKINKEDLYKHGWKKSVNWGPIRESIAASVLHQSKILNPSNKSQTLKIWDPMCGSGTFPLVAATILDQIPVRSNVDKLFNWKNWPIFKQQYLMEYFKNQQETQIFKGLNYQLILSDKDRRTINYAIDNFRCLIQNSAGKIKADKDQHFQSPLFPSKTIQSQVLQLVNQKIGFSCGDFEQVMKILIDKKQINEKTSGLNIITNLPYIQSRSAQKHPLNQLISIYKRFSSMIRQNKQFIDNVFIVIDKNIADKNHFLNVSSQKWTLVSQYTSGGLQIGLYAWEYNRIPKNVEETSLQISSVNRLQLTSEQRQLILKKEKSAQRALIQYRKKLSEIDRKYYKLPKHLLMKDLKGWKRILEKRRTRHLQSAYQLFARRRDRLIALKHYARQKLQLKMLKRGTVWKNKNLRFFDNNANKLEEYSDQIKQIFQNKIEAALKRQEQFKQRLKIKQGDKMQIAKVNNKWNSDEKKMISQIKNSKASQITGRKRNYDPKKKQQKTNYNSRRK